MRAALAAALCISLCSALPAEAQSRLPRRSAPERQVEDINRNIQRDQRQRRLEEQVQTDTNQIRQNIDRQRLFSSPPPITIPSGRRSTCPPGAVGCR